MAPLGRPSSFGRTTSFARKVTRWDEKVSRDVSLCLEDALNPVFRALLLSVPVQEVDRDRKGCLVFADFLEFFHPCAPDNEIRIAFDAIDVERSGSITYGLFQYFQAKNDPDPMDRHGKLGSPDCLTYSCLLEGVRRSCDRQALLRRLEVDREPFPPSEQWLLDAMETEWTANPKLWVHWEYVANPVPYDPEGRRFPNRAGGSTVRDTGHEGMSVEDFCSEPEARAARLAVPEVVALRLYTGPGYEALNSQLRNKAPGFAVTQYCLDSAVGKLALPTPPRPLLRGLKKQMPPHWHTQYRLYRGIGDRRLVLSDPGFVSTTTDVEVATGQDFGGQVLFTLQTRPPVHGPTTGFLANGADVQWVSQYPEEAEVLLPSNALLVPRVRCPHIPAVETPLPDEVSAYHFAVFYPWDFAQNAPLVTQDFLPCANELLELVRGLEMEFAALCCHHRGPGSERCSSLLATMRRKSVPLYTPASLTDPILELAPGSSPPSEQVISPSSVRSPLGSFDEDLGFGGWTPTLLNLPLPGLDPLDFATYPV